MDCKHITNIIMIDITIIGISKGIIKHPSTACRLQGASLSISMVVRDNLVLLYFKSCSSDKHAVCTMHSAPNLEVCALRRTQKCAPNFACRGSGAISWN